MSNPYKRGKHPTKYTQERIDRWGHVLDSRTYDGYIRRRRESGNRRFSTVEIDEKMLAELGFELTQNKGLHRLPFEVILKIGKVVIKQTV